MQRRSTAGDLIPIDLEINATCRRRNSERIRNFLQDLEVAATPEEEPRSSEASSSFPIAGHSHIEPVEDTIMVEEPRRVTLEDYSSSTVAQFFTSIAQPEFLDASAGGKIIMKAPNEAMDLIESMAASDIAILRDRAHISTKKSLLELTSQDALLAQNKLLSKQLEAFTETLTQWQNHPGNQFNRDQGGSSTRPQQQMLSLYDRTTKLEETLAQFMQVSMSNQKSTEFAIKNLEVQVGQLAKQLAERPSNNFTTNTEKNPKKECKVVMTRSKMAIQAEESRADQKVEGFKQQLADKLALEPVDDLVELKEIVEEAEGDEERETPIKAKEIKEEEEKEKKLKNEKQKEKVVEIEKKKGKSEANIEKKKEATPIECKEVPYPLVPSRKDRERHLARFLDIFKKLEITLSF
ncbi:hypothetical protein GmHk_03G006836 [Glycine max]|nr:hypothetical protein GmHk_03G006836 [Glycine max]